MARREGPRLYRSLEQLELWAWAKARFVRRLQCGAETTLGPLRKLERSLIREGSLPRGAATCLYLSAGSDTRAFSYLRPEVLSELRLPASTFPNFFVLVDGWVDPDDPALALTYSDERTNVSEEGVREVGGFGVKARLLRVRVRSRSLPPRELIVLRLKAENEAFARLALREGWKPEWVIGICDGCLNFGGNNRCENDISSVEHSIPMRLGVRYWVTDHLRYGDQWIGGDNGRRAITEPDGQIRLPDGRTIRELFAWRRWPNSPTPRGEDRSHWICLYEVDVTRKGHLTHARQSSELPGAISEVPRAKLKRWH